MSKKNKRVKLQSKEEDRISYLPDSLVQHILSFLPSTKDAIHTTLLSKRWHNQWTRVPSSSSIPLVCLSKNSLDSSIIHYFSVTAPRSRNSTCKQYRLPEFLFKHASLVKLHTYDCNFVSMPNGSISWGNLKALNIEHCHLPSKAIENILRGSPSLESLELVSNTSISDEYVIVSNSLKKLVLKDFWSVRLQISWTNLEEFNLFGIVFTWNHPNLMNCPSLICANVDFECDEVFMGVDIEIISHFQRVKELKFGSQFIKILSALNLEGHLSPLLLNNKFLTLDRPNFEEHSGGIECALRIYHVLEKLVITLPFYKSQRTTNLPDLNGSGENYWNSNREVFDCLASHLKIIEINGLCESDDKCKYVLNFIEFLLKSVRVLEKLVVILKDGGKDFVIQVSKKLLDFPRCSQHATVKLLCSN
ncbi:F-box/LRR-repeat protein At5g02910-like isoform X2 [Euphorbia lathyris]|uniref:F-box/LRR-repeat protein At5g02910-like isoform X2 n=1 Tax=Euphorbia lathyris TaxID=212925 RepID=UPI003313EB12